MGNNESIQQQQQVNSSKRASRNGSNRSVNKRKHKSREQPESTLEPEIEPDNLCEFPEIDPSTPPGIPHASTESKTQASRTRNIAAFLSSATRRYSDMPSSARAGFSRASRRNSTPTHKNAAKANIDVSNCQEMKLPENTPYCPDLITCCQNVATFLAEAAARSKNFSNRPAPSVEYVYGYMRFLFAILQLEPECCVYADIYFRRLLSKAKGTLKIHSGNWHKILVGACLLASKYVDDLTMDNRDFSAALTGCSLQFMNKLESKYLNMLNWRLHVPISEYTTRYFELAKKQDQVRDWDSHFEEVKPHFTVTVH